MAVDRDDQHEERLARIEQMLEDLKREMRRFNDFHQQAVEAEQLLSDRSGKTDVKKAVSTPRRRPARRKRTAKF